MKSKLLLLVILLVLLVGASCKKNIGSQAPPPPSFTGKTWIMDTIIINPPDTYNTLNDDEKFSYRAALGWHLNAELTFNEDGAITTGGDWDFGYETWQLINDDDDIEVSLVSGADTLRQWIVNTTFTYTKTLNGSFNCTYIYK